MKAIKKKKIMKVGGIIFAVVMIFAMLGFLLLPLLSIV
jgi:uncharacterized membrane protein YvbJ